jgi:serine/threonine protein kinase
MTAVSGAQLGPYVLEGLIARGASGEVYRARDAVQNRCAAVKLIAPSRSITQDAFARFARQAAIWSSLDHAGLAAVYHVGLFDGIPYVASELLTGETLRARLARGPMHPAEAIHCALRVTDALAAAHRLGIVHRDLRPEHVYVTRHGTVKVIDLGLARCLDEVLEVVQHAAAELTPATLSRIAYLSPEQVRGEAADARADIFSVGALLYEMVSGAAPFRGRSVVATLDAILGHDPPKLSAESCPASLQAVIRRCLEKHPQRRYQSARALYLSLDRANR